MKERTLAGLLTLLFVLAGIGSLRADLPGARFFRQNPGPPIPHLHENAVPIRIEVSTTAQQPTLFVPKSLLSRARKIALAPGAPALAQSRSNSWFPAAVLVVGFGLSGLLLVQRRCRWIVPGLLLTVVLWRSSSGAWANPVVPPGYKLPQAQPQANPPFAVKEVLVETTEEGHCIRLVLPRATAAELAAQGQ